MEDIYEYVGQNTMTPYYEGWENRLCEGEGLGYGSELYAEFRKGKWDYYCSTGKKINITAEAKKKISDMYFWKTLYLGCR